VAVVLLWPDDDAATLSQDPPYGLTEIEMPATDAAVIAALERMPAIDGRQPTLLRDEAMVVYEGTEAEAPGIYRSIGVVLDPPPGPDDDPFDPEALADDFASIVDVGGEKVWIVEASAFDPDGDLLWVVFIEPETDDLIPAYHVMWAEPTAEGDLYYLSGDTPEFRVKLVHAFINAVGE
jgi:hypothetical protein